MSSRAAGSTCDETAGDVGHHREEHEHRGHHHLAQRAERPEPVVHQRRERDDRDGVGRDRQRQERVGAIANRDAMNADTTAASRADGQPADRLDRTSPATRPAAKGPPPQLSESAVRSPTVAGGGMPSGRGADADFPEDEHADEHDHGRRRSRRGPGRTPAPRPGSGPAERRVIVPTSAVNRPRPRTPGAGRTRSRPRRRRSAPSWPRSASRTAVTSSK